MKAKIEQLLQSYLEKKFIFDRDPDSRVLVLHGSDGKVGCVCFSLLGMIMVRGIHTKVGLLHLFFVAEQQKILK